MGNWWLFVCRWIVSWCAFLICAKLTPTSCKMDNCAQDGEHPWSYTYFCTINTVSIAKRTPSNMTVQLRAHTGCYVIFIVTSKAWPSMREIKHKDCSVGLNAPRGTDGRRARQGSSSWSPDSYEITDLSMPPWHRANFCPVLLTGTLRDYLNARQIIGGDGFFLCKCVINAVNSRCCRYSRTENVCVEFCFHTRAVVILCYSVKLYDVLANEGLFSLLPMFWRFK